MTVKLFHTAMIKNTKEIVKYFEENGIEYVTQDITKKPITWIEFKEIVEMAEEGIDSIIPFKPTKEAKAILESIDFDQITLREFYELSVKNPCIIRTPLSMSHNNLMVGYNQDELCIFQNRKNKRAKFNQLLEAVRMMENYGNEQAMRYSL